MQGATEANVAVTRRSAIVHPLEPERIHSAPSAADVLLSYFAELRAAGGPKPADYPALTRACDDYAELIDRGRVSLGDLARLRRTLGDALAEDTMQGLALKKPRGYAGDFELIDRMYLRTVSRRPDVSRWDEYYHSQPAAQAVRNRLNFFHAELNAVEKRFSDCGEINVLNVASGPGRDILEFFVAHPESRIRFRCIEQDGEAVEYAKVLNAPWPERLDFDQRNVLRFAAAEQKYRLIWSGGLFDYFSDRVFVHVLRRLLSALDADGRLVIGNFSTANPSRAYMEAVFDWRLEYRTPDELIALATEAGVKRERITVESEPAGVNLFLTIQA